jgi:hypothetical protein
VLGIPADRPDVHKNRGAFGYVVPHDLA